MGVNGFPTLKIIRPGKKPGRPNVEDYQGARNAKAIVDSVKDKIPNHVTRLTDKALQEWLTEGNDTAKAMLFSDKGITSALLKALAVDYLGSLRVAQIRDKEKVAAAMFGISSYPTFVLLPGGEAPAVLYDGEMTKAGMAAFLSQAASPNPDPAPQKAKSKSKSSTKQDKKASKAKASFSAASASHASADSVKAKASQTAETLDDNTNPTASPNPNVVTDDAQLPVQVPDVAPMIPQLEDAASLQQACLTVKSGTCILALLPLDGAAPDSNAAQGLLGLSEIRHKHTARGGKLFPFYAVPATNTESGNLRSLLSLAADSEIQVLAMNGKKKWVKRYAGNEYNRDAIETWIDAVRMGEGKKETLPESLIVEASPQTPPIEIKMDLPDDEPLQFQLEELSDEEADKLMRKAQEAGAKANQHDEL